MTRLAVTEAPPPQFQVITLVGKLTTDPVRKQLDDERKVCNLCVAVNDKKASSPARCAGRPVGRPSTVSSSASTDSASTVSIASSSRVGERAAGQRQSCAFPASVPPSSYPSGGPLRGQHWRRLEKIGRPDRDARTAMLARTMVRE
jgi:hypothetical protein